MPKAAIPRCIMIMRWSTPANMAMAVLPEQFKASVTPKAYLRL
jgi:hypothetical protein